MNITNKTILITGGGSGIGLEIARVLSSENKVIIIGRNKEKLEAAARALPNVVALPADITNTNAVNRLVEEINNKHGELSILVNNAANAYAYTFSETSDAYTKAVSEFSTNYFAPIRLIEKLLPVLKQQPEAAIINVSSIVALTPGVAVPTYSDSKAALHSYTQSLRRVLSNHSTIKVFELMPPLVNTDLSVEIGGRERGIPAADVARSLINGIKEDIYEIHVGLTEFFYNRFFISSREAFDAMNQKAL